MAEKTNRVRQNPDYTPRVDDTDRILLSWLAEDGTLSYADLGAKVHLSAPAVHERVRKLKQDGVIKGLVARLDGTLLGKPLLCFVQVIANNIKKTEQVAKLSDIPDIEEIHSVTGESGMLLKIRTADTRSLEAILERIHEIEGIIGTRSQIVLTTLLERGVSPNK